MGPAQAACTRRIPAQPGTRSVPQTGEEALTDNCLLTSRAGPVALPRVLCPPRTPARMSPVAPMVAATMVSASAPTGSADRRAKFRLPPARSLRRMTVPTGANRRLHRLRRAMIALACWTETRSLIHVACAAARMRALTVPAMRTAKPTEMSAVTVTQPNRKTAPPTARVCGAETPSLTAATSAAGTGRPVWTVSGCRSGSRTPTAAGCAHFTSCGCSPTDRSAPRASRAAKGKSAKVAAPVNTVPARGRAWT